MIPEHLLLKYLVACLKMFDDVTLYAAHLFYVFYRPTLVRFVMTKRVRTQK